MTLNFFFRNLSQSIESNFFLSIDYISFIWTFEIFKLAAIYSNKKFVQLCKIQNVSLSDHRVTFFIRCILVFITLYTARIQIRVLYGIDWRIWFYWFWIYISSCNHKHYCQYVLASGSIRYKFHTYGFKLDRREIEIALLSKSKRI